MGDEVTQGTARRDALGLFRAVRDGRRGPRPDGEVRGALRRAGLPPCNEAEPTWLRQFQFAAAAEEVPKARHDVRRLLEGLGLDGASLAALQLAVGEALANAVKHGSPRARADKVVVSVGLCREGVAVEVRDQGDGFTGSPICMPDGQAMAGRGILLMRALTDRVRFECSPHGTAVLLLKGSG